jgi:valyl-tRNA synthetase
LSSAAGNDLLFDEDLMLQGRNFMTKIWSAFRLINMWNHEDKPAVATDNQAIEWFENKLNKTIAEINDQFEKFRISDALHLIYKLIWDDFVVGILKQSNQIMEKEFLKKFMIKPLLSLKN